MFKDSSPGRQICGSVPPLPETGSLQHLSFWKHSSITKSNLADFSYSAHAWQALKGEGERGIILGVRRKEGVGVGKPELNNSFSPSQAPAIPPSSSSFKSAKFFVNYDLDNSCRSSEFTV